MDKIFSSFLSRPIDTREIAVKRQAYRSWFINNYPLDVFSKGDKLFRLLLEYSDRLDILLAEKYIDQYIEIQLHEDVFKYRIIVEGAEGKTFSNPLEAEGIVRKAGEYIKNTYYELLTSSEGNIEDFKADMDAWVTVKLKDTLQDLYIHGMEIIDATSGKLIGASDALNYTLDQVTIIQDVFNKDKLETLSDNPMDENKALVFCTDTGIPAIDEDTQGIFKGQLTMIEGSPKLGKTSWTLGCPVYRAVTEYKQNVDINALEQKKAEVKASLTARHIVTLFGEYIDAGSIAKGTIDDPEILRKIKIAQQDLFENPNYGKIHITGSEETMYIETMYSTLKMRDRLYGPFDLVVIDQAPWVKQKPGPYRNKMSRYEISQQAIQISKQYGATQNKAMIMLNQRNKDGIKASEKGAEASMGDSQGGIESAQTADTLIVISATQAMKLQNTRYIDMPASRSSAGVSRLLIMTQIASCYFEQAKR